MAVSWWDTLWKKYILGVLAIGSGLMLGREGPSIQLGAMGGKGVAHHLKVSPVEERSLIASGAAAGLAAAFNAPIAGLLSCGGGGLPSFFSILLDFDLGR